CQADGTSFPTGDTTPSPVITTRRRLTYLLLARFRQKAGAPGRSRSARPSCARRRSALRIRLHVIDRLLDRRDLLGFLVGNLGFELVLERHHQLDGVERVGTQIVD